MKEKKIAPNLQIPWISLSLNVRKLTRAYGITNCMYHNNKSDGDVISEPIRKEIGLPLHLVTCLKGGDS